MTARKGVGDSEGKDCWVDLEVAAGLHKNRCVPDK